MADDTMMRSQQFAAPFQAQATQRKFDIYEGVARGQQTAFNQILAVQEMAERSKVNAVHTAVEEAKLIEFQKRNLVIDQMLNLEVKMAQARLARAQADAQRSAIETAQQETERHVKFLGQPIEVNGEWFKLMPSGGGKVIHVPLSKEEADYAKRERVAKTSRYEAEAEEDRARAEWYRKGGSAAFQAQGAAPHPSLERSRDAGTLEKMAMPVTPENIARLKHPGMPLLDKPLTPEEIKQREAWAMKYAETHGKKHGRTTDQAYRELLEDLDRVPGLYAAFREETGSR